MNSKRELQEENERLREKLEEAYDVIGDALDLEDDSESDNPKRSRKSTVDLDDEE